MAIKNISSRPLSIPFKQAFAHASAVRAATETVLVTVTGETGLTGTGEGCPRHYVTGETVDAAMHFIDAHRDQWRGLNKVEDVKQWVADHDSTIDQHPAAWCGVETALLDLIGKETSRPIDVLLGLPPLSGRFQYSAVLGTESVDTFDRQLKQFLAAGFTDFKVKVTGRLQDDMEKLMSLGSANIPSQRIRLDANNLWKRPEDAIAYLKRMPYPAAAIEEPLHAGDYDGCLMMAQELGVKIILDESLLRLDQFSAIHDSPSIWIINIRVSKMGGIIRSLAVAEQAKKIGIPIVIGAQVGETNILTRAALTVAHCYRDSLLAQEGAFGTHLLERDICQPVLMFGQNGFLDPGAISAQAGLGLSLDSLL